jgi:hypothetical protein
MEIIQHIVNYTLDELKEIDKLGEVFRKYPKNPKKAYFDYRKCIEDITNEIEISNLGNVKVNGNIVHPFIKDDGDLYVTLQDKIDYKVYRLVAETWVEFTYEDTVNWDVHHIINNGPNIPENLIWIDHNLHFNKLHK